MTAHLIIIGLLSLILCVLYIVGYINHIYGNSKVSKYCAISIIILFIVAIILGHYWPIK